ncbi:hypothetical protein BAMA_05575 [Bacillus manliponensis]|uniref:DUF3951 domain-containing protein n=1 Tax=Bacillus manliponensis TaxID=574376 RepID=A0A073K8C6_9BACI|nr:DUF3951 domain-containing protein [Bacillus manliponensis]KEK18488.1 hypothetical protein BAMA_05575 [Bacillus manliponensis]
MDPLQLAAMGLPLAIVILTLIGFYKLFVKKKNITAFYTPFDQIMGQTTVEFHQEQHVVEEDEGEGDDKDKNDKKMKKSDIKI